MDKTLDCGDGRPTFRDMSILRPQIEALILQIPQLAPHFLIEATGEGSMNAVCVSVAMRPAWCTACKEEREGYAQALRESVKACLGLSIDVRVNEAGVVD